MQYSNLIIQKSTGKIYAHIYDYTYAYFTHTHRDVNTQSQYTTQNVFIKHLHTFK